MAKLMLPLDNFSAIIRQFQAMLNGGISAENIKQPIELELYLTSPSGTKYKVVVDDAGILGTEPL